LLEVISDQHLPGLMTHALQERGIGVRVMAWAPELKTRAFHALRARIHAGLIELYQPVPDVPLRDELLRLRTRYRANSAQVEVGRVGDSHGDLAMALAAVVLQHDVISPSRPLEHRIGPELGEYRIGVVLPGEELAVNPHGRMGTPPPGWGDNGTAGIRGMRF